MAFRMSSTPPNKATFLNVVWVRILPRDVARSPNVLQAFWYCSPLNSLDRAFIKYLQKGKKSVHMWKHTIIQHFHPQVDTFTQPQSWTSVLVVCSGEESLVKSQELEITSGDNTKEIYIPEEFKMMLWRTMNQYMQIRTHAHTCTHMHTHIHLLHPSSYLLVSLSLSDKKLDFSTGYIVRFLYLAHPIT